MVAVTAHGACLLLLILILQIMHAHDFVAAGVDDFDGDAGVFADRERERCCAAELFKLVFVDDTFKGAGDFVPCRLVGKEGLPDAKGTTIIVGVDELCGDFVCTCGIHCVVYWVVDVHAFHFDEVFPVGCSFKLCTRHSEYGEQLCRGCFLE